MSPAIHTDDTNKDLIETEIGLVPKTWENRELFVKILLDFLNKEKFLLENNLNERTITHKLAELLDIEFSKLEYDVDCEYNRMENRNMSYEESAKRLNLLDEVSTEEDELGQGITVFPDIIIHKRKDNSKNLLVIEVKKTEYANKTRGQLEETYRDFDKRKLCAYTKELKYVYGVYLEFNKKELCADKTLFFSKGEQVK
ncbi:MAG: hypothetical protein UV60_C0008G0036 [Parcubacteria group bacterium GW2011_GWA2_43_11]|nr:MAG: hypothetical protein UU89_C0016G0007 [Parcubacteria group bacterium GW2011_GWC2_42_11]KKS85414.1 MAG: hypothetical protein UV60_C0008G0036 [Parcubacteria group bacterium GW2011_GWA2_43_11]